MSSSEVVKPALIVIASDVLVIHHLTLRNDPRWSENEEALRRLRGSTKGITIYALLDLVGAVSRYVGERSGRELYLSYLRSEEHRILFPPHPDSWEEHIEEVMRYIGRGLSYKEALEALAIETTPEAEFYLTWRTGIADRFPVRIRTPKEVIQQKASTTP